VEICRTKDAKYQESKGSNWRWQADAQPESEGHTNSYNPPSPSPQQTYSISTFLSRNTASTPASERIAANNSSSTFWQS
jgi:hypothetical protein